PGADEDTVLRRIEDYARRRSPRRSFVGRVHRLDRETSGALAVALSPPARGGLIELFRGHLVDRRYLALVAGQPRKDHGTIEAPIHDSYESGRRRVSRLGEPGRPALTSWTVRERLGPATLLEVRLGTGRQHQVRVHLAHAGMPVVGDHVYGRGEAAVDAP